jgi:hypothetical protein
MSVTHIKVDVEQQDYLGSSGKHGDVPQQVDRILGQATHLALTLKRLRIPYHNMHVYPLGSAGRSQPPLLQHRQLLPDISD